LHCVLFGLHTPPHAPELQTNWHAAALVHCPLALHVWGTLPTHCLLLGVQTPQTPAPTHTPAQGVLF
jgi:hypothetical protein